MDDLTPELREAAEAWAASGGVASEAAEALNASETTVRRRVTRVGQLLDLDLESLGGFCALRTLLVASATSMS
ncbi:helix-turn-helix domain-containing protein [Conexibacter sp. W3-3-2]|uniref:helix-turn-helix domain-containing protein n=1 Tax=Conexibacter sp. W3-3-2 TaxID=2675227 RepID=UPI0018A900C7